MIIVITLSIVCAVLLVLVVLAQNSKGGGLSDQFGGGGASQLMGVKRTGDLLEKITWGLIITIFVLSVTSKAFVSTEPTEEIDNSVETPAMPAQQQPAAATQNQDAGLSEELSTEEAPATEEQPAE